MVNMLRAKGNLGFCGGLCSLYTLVHRTIPTETAQPHQSRFPVCLPARPCSLVKLGRAQLKVAAQGTLYLLT